MPRRRSTLSIRLPCLALPYHLCPLPLPLPYISGLNALPLGTHASAFRGIINLASRHGGTPVLRSIHCIIENPQQASKHQLTCQSGLLFPLSMYFCTRATLMFGRNEKEMPNVWIFAAHHPSSIHNCCSTSSIAVTNLVVAQGSVDGVVGITYGLDSVPIHTVSVMHVRPMQSFCSRLEPACLPAVGLIHAFHVFASPLRGIPEESFSDVSLGGHKVRSCPGGASLVVSVHRRISETLPISQWSRCVIRRDSGLVVVIDL
ncbi:hypothetical protein V8C44DRAFT_331485 [Trichoderma aethiopicum]